MPLWVTLLCVSAALATQPVAGQSGTTEITPLHGPCDLSTVAVQQQAGANGNGDGPKVPLVPQTRAKVSSGVMAGQLLRRVMPVYPPMAKQDRISGATVLHVVIGKDGKVLLVEPVSGPEVLRGEAVRAVKQWEYRPYVLNGNRPR